MAKSGTTSGQAHLWSDVPPGRDIPWPNLELLQVRLTLVDVPPVEASSSQEWYYFRSG